MMPAPDYPTDAEIITPRDELILDLYQKWSTARIANASALWAKESKMGYRYHYRAALPGVRFASVLEQIAHANAGASKLPMVADLRDES